jgi:circadian clock protein KaiB
MGMRSPQRGNGRVKGSRSSAQASAKRDGRRYRFKLYVSGATERSSRAITNLKALCDEYLPGAYDLEVIDIYQQPEKARTEQLIAAPTLVKLLPLPLRRFIGDLSDTERVMTGLEIGTPE